MKLILIPLAVLALVLAVPPAAADLDGDCTADINGVSARLYDSSSTLDALEVREGDEVSYYFASAGQDIAHIKVSVTIAGQKIVLHEESWEDETQKSVDGNHKFEGLPGGVAGLFYYEGAVTYQDGGTCSGSLLVNVIPTTTFTPVVIGGVVVTGSGMVGLAALAAKAAAGSKEALAALKAMLGSP